MCLVERSGRNDRKKVCVRIYLLILRSSIIHIMRTTIYTTVCISKSVISASCALFYLFLSTSVLFLPSYVTRYLPSDKVQGTYCFPIRMYPRASLSCQIVWDKGGGRTCRMACASTSDGSHRVLLRTISWWNCRIVGKKVDWSV